MSKLSVAVLRHRDFRFLLLTRMFATMALQSQAVIVGWQIYSLTKDPFLLGLTGLVEAVPAILSALFAGHIVDNGKPHRIYILCIGSLLLNILVLTLFAGSFAPAPGGSLLPWLFGGVFLSGLGRSFMVPASFTIMSQIVPKNEIAAATAWRTSGFQTATILGPALAGLTYGGYGPGGAWLLTAGLIIAAFVFICSMKTPSGKRAEEKRESAIKSIRAGWKFMLTHRVLFSMMLLDMLAVLFGGAVAMLPAYADQILHVGSEGLGALRAAPALGAVVTTLSLALFPMRQVSAVRLLWAVMGFGVCMIGFGLSNVFWLSMLFLALSGMFDSVSMVIRSTLLLLLTPDDMRGRVSSISSMFIISSNEIGAFESGVAAKFLGLVPSVVLGGIGTLIVTSIIAIKTPALRKTVIDTEKG